MNSLCTRLVYLEFLRLFCIITVLPAHIEAFASKHNLCSLLKGHANNTKHLPTYFVIAGKACIKEECSLKTKAFFRFKPLQISVSEIYLIVVFWLLN